MRPKQIKKDANHWIPRDFLRDRLGGFETVQFSKGTPRAYTANYQGFRVVLFDTADFGGVWSDWLLFCLDTEAYCILEVKTEEAYKKKDNDMTEGERWLFSLFKNRFRLIVTDEDMRGVMDELIAERIAA